VVRRRRPQLRNSGGAFGAANGAAWLERTAGGSASRRGTFPGMGLSLPLLSFGDALEQSFQHKDAAGAGALPARAFFDDPARIHYRKAVRHLRDHAEVVRDE